MAHAHILVLQRFYEAFARRDAEVMAACYAPDVHFSDPVFPDLHGEHARNMWRMLCANAKELEITSRDLSADDTTGRAHWEAQYTFSATKRRVHNVIEARFELRDGLITRHVDTFDLWRWTRMALGPVGYVLGWGPIVQNSVRDRARRGLEAFEKKR